MILYFKKNLLLIIFLFLYRCTFTFSICCLNEERDNIKSSDLFALMENENKKFLDDLKLYLRSHKLKSLTFDVFTSEVCELLVKGVNNFDLDSIDKCKKTENENLDINEKGKTNEKVNQNCIDNIIKSFFKPNNSYKFNTI